MRDYGRPIRYVFAVYFFLTFLLVVGCTDQTGPGAQVSDAEILAAALERDPDARFVGVRQGDAVRWLTAEPPALLLECDVRKVRALRHTLDWDTQQWVAMKFLKWDLVALSMGLQAEAWTPCCNGPGEPCTWAQLESEQCVSSLNSLCQVSNCFTFMTLLDHQNNGSGPCCGGV